MGQLNSRCIVPAVRQGSVVREDGDEVLIRGVAVRDEFDGKL